MCVRKTTHKLSTAGQLKATELTEFAGGGGGGVSFSPAGYFVLGIFSLFW